MPQQFPAIRLVALDLDGTLLNREGHVTPRTRAALQAAVDKGVYIVPATGRPLASLPPEVAQLPGIRYVITCNGACGTWAQTPWAQCTAAIPTRKSTVPAPRSACCTA